MTVSTADIWRSFWEEPLPLTAHHSGHPGEVLGWGESSSLNSAVLVCRKQNLFKRIFQKCVNDLSLSQAFVLRVGCYLPSCFKKKQFSIPVAVYVLTETQTVVNLLILHHTSHSFHQWEVPLWTLDYICRHIVWVLYSNSSQPPVQMSLAFFDMLKQFCLSY